MSWRWCWWPVRRWCCCDHSSSSLLFLRCFFFYHLASLLLFPSGGSKRKVGGGVAVRMISLDRWVEGDAGDRFGGGVAAVALPLLSLLLLFVSYVPSVNNVLPSLQRLRGHVGGRCLGSWFWPVDGYSSFFLCVFLLSFPSLFLFFPLCFFCCLFLPSSSAVHPLAFIARGCKCFTFVVARME